jgi:head-tail adaptor
MPRLVRTTRRRERVPVGDLSERIFVENRSLPTPVYGSAAEDMVFTPFEQNAQVWANVETVVGVTFFDSVAGLDRPVSHIVVMRWIEGVSAETWLRLDDGTRLDIVSVSTIDARHEFLRVQAAATGSNTQGVSSV